VSDETDPQLDAHVADLRAQIESNLPSEASPSTFEAIASRAAELSEWTEGDLDPSADREHEFGEHEFGEHEFVEGVDGRDEDLAPFVVALQGLLDEELDTATQETAAAPPPSEDGERGKRAKPSKRGAMAVGIGLVIALAAAVALFVAPRIGLRDGASRQGVEAPHVDSSDQEAHLALERFPERARRGRRDGGGGDEDGATALPVAEEVLPEVAPMDGAVVADEAPEPRTRSKASPRRDRIAELEEEAQAHLAARDYAQAERKLRKIIERGGVSRASELAHGDLFAVVRAQGRDLVPEWKSYLATFPRGRYAEDARAGLCRRATGAKRDECWAIYERDFPQGSHRPASTGGRKTEPKRDPATASGDPHSAGENAG
jgi:hypothetical protein